MEYEGKEKISNFDQINQSPQVDKLKINEEEDYQDEDDHIIYDKILDKYGYGPEILKIIISSAIITYFDGYFTHYFSSMSLIYIKILNLNTTQLSIIPIVFYLFKSLGCFFVAYLSKFINRIKIVKFSVMILICNTFIQVVIKNYYFLLFLRMEEGFLTGCIEVIASNVLVEFLPIKYRGFVLIIIWLGYVLSQFILAIILNIVLPNLEVDRINYVFLFQSLVFYLFFIVILIYYREGPRTLILQKNEDRALEFLYKIKNEESFTKQLKSKIIKQIYNEEYIDRSFIHNSKILFGKKYLLTTFVLAFTITSTTILGDGVTTITTLLLTTSNINSSLWFSIIIINFFAICSFFIYAYLSEVKSFGRIKTIFIGFILYIFVSLLFIIIPDQITFVFSLLNLLTPLNALINAYLNEFYPTNIRDFATGQISCFAYFINGLVSFLFIHLIFSHKIFIYIILVGISILSAFLACLLSVETNGIPLDSFEKESIESEENYKLINK